MSDNKYAQGDVYFNVKFLNIFLEEYPGLEVRVIEFEFSMNETALKRVTVGKVAKKECLNTPIATDE